MLCIALSTLYIMLSAVDSRHSIAPIQLIESVKSISISTEIKSFILNEKKKKKIKHKKSNQISN